jgi:hypothetical protein
MKKVAIMQPYFLPYIGYFQLIAAVDVFVIYDNIQFSKKGWIHRNRMLSNGKDEYFSLTLKKDSDFLDVKDRLLSDTWSEEREKILRKIKESYRKAPHFERLFPMVQDIFYFEEKNLFSFILNSLNTILVYLQIDTPVIVSSNLAADHTLKSQSRVIDICLNQGADHYINPIGGWDLYKNDDFAKVGIELSFIKSRAFEYPQFGMSFVSWLSILDILMFNDLEKIKTQLFEFDLLKNASS